MCRVWPIGCHRDFTPSAVYNGVEASINVAINAETGFAYLLTSTGGETCGGGAHIVDIGEPLDPVFADCFAHPGTGRALTGTTHDAHCVVYHGPDKAYRGRKICLSANETAISVADLSDKRNPDPVATAQYPRVAYAHQGWLTEDHRHFYSTDEMDEMTATAERQRTLIWDVSDLDDPVLVKEYFAPASGPEHNLHVRVVTGSTSPTSGPGCAFWTSATPRTRSRRVISTRRPRERTSRGSWGRGASIRSSRAGACWCPAGPGGCSSCVPGNSRRCWRRVGRGGYSSE